MTLEQRVFIRIPSAAEPQVRKLVSLAEAALDRSRKLPPGDRTETSRFDAIHAAIDQLAVAAWANGEPSEILPVATDVGLVGPTVYVPEGDKDGAAGEAAAWIEAGHLVVELRLPHFPGPTRLEGTSGVGPPNPADRWESRTRRAKDAVRERFDHLLRLALSGSTKGEACIQPSGVANSALTEGLREHVHHRGGQPRVDVPVVYRDGSKGPPFPLRALSVSDQKPEGWASLRLTLLSIRHVEMDHLVDGAWLRNAKVSRPRPAGLTDTAVFETSRRQFRLLAKDPPTLLYLYQTGLEPAILGFYRALVHELLNRPGSVAVVPCYYNRDGSFSEGRVWATGSM
jgi:hypothetical protein